MNKAIAAANYDYIIAEIDGILLCFNHFVKIISCLLQKKDIGYLAQRVNIQRHCYLIIFKKIIHFNIF
jgi:hypothetical protein